MSKLEFYEWIPVLERLPDNPFLCIVTLGWQNGEVSVSTGYFNDRWHLTHYKAEAHQIFAWMPLPKPYNPQP